MSTSREGHLHAVGKPCQLPQDALTPTMAMGCVFGCINPAPAGPAAAVPAATAACPVLHSADKSGPAAVSVLQPLLSPLPLAAWITA
jgi:hypothetical protein